MKYLLIGGTGTVGREVVAGLVKRGADVRVMTRSQERAQALSSGVEGVVGDLLEPSTFPAVFEGASRMFLLNAVSVSELNEGMLAVAEARRRGIERIVYLSVHDADVGVDVPHFASKLAMEAAIKASGIAYTILRPNSFFQNDYWFKEPLLRYGVYPNPIGPIGCSRVDARDIGEAAARSLVEDDFVNETVHLVGSTVWQAENSVAAWSEALGKPLQYGGDDLDAWAERSRAFQPGWAVYDLRLMFELFHRRGLVATEAQQAETMRILGRPPRTFEDFVAETARAWQS